MLVITKGQTGQTVIVTLNEKVSIAGPYYQFEFVNITTKDAIKAVYRYDDDLSGYPERYNEFSIDESIFDDAPAGQYIYKVYEKATGGITDTTGLTPIEVGKLNLNPETEIVRNGYTAETTTRQGYAG